MLAHPPALAVPLAAAALRALPHSERLVILSYPKCGRTWLTLLLTSLLEGRAATVMMLLLWRNSHGEDVHRHPFTVTAEELTQSFRAHRAATNGGASGSGSTYFNGADKVVLLLRDPMDVLVSSFHERKNRGGFNGYWEVGYRLPSNTSLDDYVEQAGLSSYIAFLNSWVPVAFELPDRVFILHYEALLQCPVHALAAVANGFLGLGVPCAALRAAVAGNAFDRLQVWSQTSWNPYMSPVDAADPQSAKFRKGRAHAAHEELSARAFERARGDLAGVNAAVRQAFYESSRPCYMFGVGGQVGSGFGVRTEDLICGPE